MSDEMRMADPDRTYTAAEVEEIVSRRLVNQSRREDERLLKHQVADISKSVDALRKDVAEFGQRFTRLEPLLEAVKELGVLKMNPEEKAAFQLLAKQQVLHSEEREQRQMRWTRFFAIVAVAGPFVVLVLDRVWTH